MTYHYIIDVYNVHILLVGGGECSWRLGSKGAMLFFAHPLVAPATDRQMMWPYVCARDGYEENIVTTGSSEYSRNDEHLSPCETRPLNPSAFGGLSQYRTRTVRQPDGLFCILGHDPYSNPNPKVVGPTLFIVIILTICSPRFCNPVVSKLPIMDLTLFLY